MAVTVNLLILSPDGIMVSSEEQGSRYSGLLQVAVLRQAR